MGWFSKVRKFSKSLFVRSKWLSFLAGASLLLVAGNQYAISTYSSQMRFMLGFNIEKMDTLATAQNVATYAAVGMSLFYDLFGPKSTCLLCGTLCFLGYFFVYLSVSGVLQSVHYAFYIIFYVLIGSGSMAMYYAGLSPNISNFDQKYRGIVVGILVANFGASGSFFGLIFKYVLGKDVLKYLLFCACILIIIPFFSFWILTVDDPTKKEKKRSINNDDQEEKTASKSSVIKSVPFWLILFDIDFYLLFLVMFSGIGSGLLVMNSIQEMVISLLGEGEEESVCASIASTLIIIIGISNGVGRIIYGFLSDFSSKFLSRTFWLMIAILMMSISQVLLSYSSLNALYFIAVGVGSSYGGIYSCSPSFTSERWGSRWFAMNFGMTQIGSALGSILLATVLQSYFFNKFSEDGLGIHCYGKKCFTYTFMITSIICFCGVFCALLLHYRTKGMYDKILKEKEEKRTLEKGTKTDQYYEEVILM